MGFGKKTVDGWRKTLTDWKSKTKTKASALKREQQQTGGGLPPLSPLEERLLLIIGTRALEGDEAVPELGFGKVEIPRKSIIKHIMPNISLTIAPIIEMTEVAAPYVYDLEHDYVEKVEVPSTSHDICSKDIVPGKSRGLKRKMEQQGSKKSNPFRRRPNITVGFSNELLTMNQQSVEILQNISTNIESMSSSLEKISSNTEGIANC